LGQGIQSPAAGAAIPQIVPQEHLTKVNGMMSSVQSLCALASPMVGAAMMSVTSLEKLFFLDVITATIGISILIFFVKVPDLAEKQEKAGGKTGYFHDLMEGLRYIRNHGFIFRLILIFAVYMVFASPAGFLTPLQVVRNFGDDVWRLSAIEIVFSIGMMLGGVIIAAWGGFKNRIYTMAFAGFLAGFSTIGLGVTPNFWLYLGIMGFAGITITLLNTPAMVLIQSNVEPEYMGRVLSVFTMVLSSVMPLAMLLYGPMADFVNINFILVGTGIMMSLLSFALIPFGKSKALL
jgi:DHA3 family macrolide efflux protein-like MFS transporter